MLFCNFLLYFFTCDNDDLSEKLLLGAGILSDVLHVYKEPQVIWTTLKIRSFDSALDPDGKKYNVMVILVWGVYALKKYLMMK